MRQQHRPGAFIFHCSRCGSTALANALRAYGHWSPGRDNASNTHGAGRHTAAVLANATDPTDRTATAPADADMQGGPSPHAADVLPVTSPSQQLPDVPTAPNKARPRDRDVVIRLSKPPCMEAGGVDGPASRGVCTVVISEPTAVNTLLFRRLSHKTHAPTCGFGVDGGCVVSNQEHPHAKVAVPAAFTPHTGDEHAMEHNRHLRGIVGALGGGWPNNTADGTSDSARGALPPPTSLFKLTSWNVLGIDVMLSAYRSDPAIPPNTVPWLFMYRDPVEVAVSELRSEGGWLRMGRHTPTRLHRMVNRWQTHSTDTPTDTPPGTSTDIHILATTIAAYFTAALTALDAGGTSDGHPCSEGWVLHYEDFIAAPPMAAAYTNGTARDTVTDTPCAEFKQPDSTVLAKAQAVACVHRALLGAWPPWPPPRAVVDALSVYSKQHPPTVSHTHTPTLTHTHDESCAACVLVLLTLHLAVYIYSKDVIPVMHGLVSEVINVPHRGDSCQFRRFRWWCVFSLCVISQFPGAAAHGTYWGGVHCIASLWRQFNRSNRRAYIIGKYSVWMYIRGPRGRRVRR